MLKLDPYELETDGLVQTRRVALYKSYCSFYRVV